MAVIASEVREAAWHIRERGGFTLVELAFLEIARRDINEGSAHLVEWGAGHAPSIPTSSRRAATGGVISTPGGSVAGSDAAAGD